jgi:hypothetical protein
MSCGAETEANSLLTSLLAGEDVTLPELNFDDTLFQIPADIMAAIKTGVIKLTPSDITSGDIDGSGVFDLMMRGMKAHLKEEYDKNRITGAEYTKAYIALVDGALQNSVQFLIQRDQSYWTAVTAQINAMSARMQLEAVKMQLAQSKFQALTAKSEFALTKLKLATESEAYCTAKYNLDYILPLQKSQLEKALLQAQTQIDTGVYQLTYLLPAQLAMTTEQAAAQRAQTRDTLLDGTPVAGLLGKQKLLYAQQITSYQRDAEVKAAKLFTDAWITMKTIDEGLLPPDNFANTSLQAILGTIKTANGIG